MMKSIFVSLTIELLKIRRSSIFIITIGIAVFLSMMIALMMLLSMYPDSLPPGILKTKVELAAFKADWPSYMVIIEITSGAIGIIIYGFIVSWIFGREFSDHTAKDLMVLPTSRSSIVISKFLAFGLWSGLISLIIFTVSVVLGLLLNLPLWSVSLLPDFAVVFTVAALFSFLLSSPAAYVASAGKGFLPAIGFVLLCMALANFFGNIGLGAYFPWSIPLVYTGAAGDSGNQLPLISYIIIMSTSVTGIIGTVLHWKYADQHR
jgi:ABC-2 type transport system permease protein